MDSSIVDHCFCQGRVITLSFTFIFSDLSLKSANFTSLLVNLHLNAAEPLLEVLIVMLKDGDLSLNSCNLLFLLHKLHKQVLIFSELGHLMNIEASTRAAAIDGNFNNWIIGLELDLLDVSLQLVVQLMKCQSCLVDGYRRLSSSYIRSAASVIETWSSAVETCSNPSSDVGGGVSGAGVCGGGGLGIRMMTCSFSLIHGGLGAYGASVRGSLLSQDWLFIFVLGDG